MTTPDSPAGRPGLSNVVDIIVSPDAAFARLRRVPVWGWAFVVTSVLGMLGTILLTPATTHGIDVSLPAQLAANPRIAALPPERQQTVIAMQLNLMHTLLRFQFVLVPITVMLTSLVQAVVMLIASAATKGEGTFKKLFALSMTVSVVGFGLASLALSAIVLVRGSSSFDSAWAVQSSVPNLALLAPGVHGALRGFLAGINVFTVWSTVLIAIGMTRVGRIAPAAAWIVGLVFIATTVSLSALGAAQSG